MGYICGICTYECGYRECETRHDCLKLVNIELNNNNNEDDEADDMVEALRGGLTFEQAINEHRGDSGEQQSTWDKSTASAMFYWPQPTHTDAAT